MNRDMKIGIAMLLSVLMLLFVIIPNMAKAQDTRRGNLLILGDSIATGYGLSDYSSTAIPKATKSWSTLLSEKYGANQFNYAVDGATVSDLLYKVNRSDSEIDIADADVICISIGGNAFLNFLEQSTQDMSAISGIDAQAEELLAELSEELEEVFSVLREKNPTATILVQTLFHPFQDWTADAECIGHAGSTIGEWMGIYVNAYNEILKEKIEKHGFLCIDVAKEFEEIGTPNLVDTKVYETLEAILDDIDNIAPHPTQAGHEVIYNTYVATAGEKLAEALNNYMDISKYRNGNTYTYPIKDGLVFVGWYEDAAFTTPISASKQTDYAYAKFVDAKMFSLKFQMTQNTTPDSASTNLRILTSVDTLNYSKVGFRITIYGKTISRNIDTVYEKIYAYVDNCGFEIEPTVFSQESAYFVSLRIANISNDAFSVPIAIEPYWITLDGTVVEGPKSNLQTVSIEGFFTDKPEEEEDTEVIFSFDSYKDILDTEISLENDFGATRINREENYITEGEASWYVRPQGDYKVEGYYPFFRMKCYTGAFKTNDFTGYDKVLLNVYNASDEDVTIEWKFRTRLLDGEKNSKETNIDGKQYSYTLKKKAWTVCEYDLMDAIYSVRHDFENVQYMEVRIISKKEFKEDAMAELYFDNLRGHIAGNNKPTLTLNSDFEQGLSMETLSDSGYFWNENSYRLNTNVLSRVAYEDTDIPALSFMGEYGLQGRARESTWPKTRVIFDKSYPAGKYLNFMLYVQTEEDLPERLGLEGYDIQCATHSVVGGHGIFNKWTQISIQLKEESDSLQFFPSLLIGGEDATLYMDCFVISDQRVNFRDALSYDFTKGIDFEREKETYVIMGARELVYPERFKIPYTGNYMDLSRAEFDGSYTLMGTTSRPYPMIYAELGEEYEAGVRLKFRIYVKSDVSESLSLKSTLRGFMGNSSESVNYNTNISLNEWNEVDITFKTAHDRFSFFLELDGTPITADSKSAEIYYDDFRIQEYTTMEKTEWNVDKEDSTEFESWLNR